MSDIPSPVVLDILSKLPVQSLCRFRCVSKPWLALISHPRFFKIHFSKTRNQKLLLQNAGLLPVNLETISRLCNSLPVVKIERRWLDLGLDYSTYFVVGNSFNGLVCLGYKYNATGVGLLFYNPSTRESKHITDRVQGQLFGFGYVESIDDYNIVEIHHKKNKYNVRVYSLRKDSWRSVRSKFNLRFHSNTMRTVCVNGAIHSVGFYNNATTVIIAFDLVEEKFKTLPIPDFMSNIINGFRHCTIASLNDRLSLSISTLERVDVWVMEKYNGVESWTKILTTEFLGTFDVQPLCYLDNNEIMLARVHENKLIFWDSKDKKFKYFKDDWYADVPYMESLVSPSHMNESISEDKELLEYWFQ